MRKENNETTIFFPGLSYFLFVLGQWNASQSWLTHGSTSTSSIRGFSSQSTTLSTKPTGRTEQR
jgi:hypothetical protein